MVNIQVSKTFLRYAISSCTKLLPLVLRLYNRLPDEQNDLGTLSAFLTTLRSVLQLAGFESTSRDFEPIPWEYESPDEYPNPLDLLSSMEEEL